eukprot:761626-Hanusia_phi.AAC.2
MGVDLRDEGDDAGETAGEEPGEAELEAFGRELGAVAVVPRDVAAVDDDLTVLGGQPPEQPRPECLLVQRASHGRMRSVVTGGGSPVLLLSYRPSRSRADLELGTSSSSGPLWQEMRNCSWASQTHQLAAA